MGRLPDLPCLTLSQFQGYARIVFAIISFYFMPCCPLTASSFYLLSGLLDAFVDMLLESLIKVTDISNSLSHNPLPPFSCFLRTSGWAGTRESEGCYSHLCRRQSRMTWV